MIQRQTEHIVEPCLSKHEKTRLIVLTDISSITAGYKEPDDAQSLIRLLLYANEFDIEGLIATYSKHWHGNGGVKPEYIEYIIRKYGEVRDNLLLHDFRYPSEEYLMRCIKSGNPECGMEHVGRNKDTEASDWIISVVDRPDPRPIWIIIWGGATDLAQALWRVSSERNAKQLVAFKSKMRIYSIGDQYDAAGPWIREQYPDLFYITTYKAMRGMYRGGDSSLVSAEWVNENVIFNHGQLGMAYPNYAGGDPWGKVKGVKEGDTPSFLYLIPNGLSNPLYPNWGSWGGRFVSAGSQYYDAIDNYNGECSELATVYRWRKSYQASFQARMDWCVKPFNKANHEPVAVFNGDLEQTVMSGDIVNLDASASWDPDGDRLSYNWEFYQEPSSYKGKLALQTCNEEKASFVAPEIQSPNTVHIILTVTDDGIPPLSNYKRVIITIRPR